jgi:hypothetical protein
LRIAVGRRTFEKLLATGLTTILGIRPSHGGVTRVVPRASPSVRRLWRLIALANYVLLAL